MTPLQLDMQINPEDLRRLNLSLEKLGRPDLLEPVLGQIGKNVQAKAKFYPPAVPRTTVGAWYERGWGFQYNGVRGKQTSQNLGKAWYTRPNPTYVEIGNTATYAPYVHGEDQTDAHGRRGWKKLMATAIEELPAIIRKAQEQIAKIWEGRA